MSLSEALKSRIKGRGLTAYAVAKMAEVRPHVVQRFLNGERGLTLATADKLALVLGLELTPREAHARNTGTTTE
jgi:plasmid maintenance system antidote protein VapI